MFTGLVQAVGKVARADREGNGLLFEVEVPEFGALETGASVSIMGCCHTVTSARPGAFAVRSMDETLRRTVLGGLAPGSRVNLERSLRIGDEIGGHLVTGHIDGVGTVEEVEVSATETRVNVRLPDELAPFVACKGSICMDGVSLTVGEVSGSRFNVYLIPFTLEHTVAGGYAVGTRVNLEVDLVARYVARLLEARA
jgi:riboflavin synthase